MSDHEPALVAQAIHDVTCPEGPDCRDRLLHSAAQPLTHSGVLAQFLDRLAELEAADECPEIPGPDPQPVPRKRCSKCGTASCVEDAESWWYA